MKINIGNKFFIVVLIVLGVAALLHLLAPILTPFLVGALLAYLVDPLVKKLMRLGLPHLLSVLIVFVSLFSLLIVGIVMIVPVIEDQMVTLSQFISEVIVWVQKQALPALKEYLGVTELPDAANWKRVITENWSKASGLLTWTWETMLRSGRTLIEWMTRLILIPVVTFYLLRDWDKLLKAFESLLPRQWAPTIVELVKECDEVLSAFFRGELIVMLTLSIYYAAALTLAGLQVGLLVGVVAGIASIVPYLGLILGLSTASIAAYLQFGTWTAVAWVLGIFAVGQTLETAFLSPNLVGHRIGLHPVAVIFAVLTGGALFGFFGVLLALPTAAVLMVWFRFFMREYRDSHFYQ